MPPTIAEFIEPYRITKGKKFRLKDCDPGDTGRARIRIQGRSQRIDAARPGSWSRTCRTSSTRRTAGRCFLVFQAMDAAGKDGVIKHVMSGVNPQGCQVYSFKVAVERGTRSRFPLARAARLPERGTIGIFNRSYYEEVLVVKCASRTSAPNSICLPKLITDDIWEQRFEDIDSFERYLTRNGDRHPQVLPERLEEGAEETLPRPARRPGEELEILRCRHQANATAGTTTWTRTSMHPPYRHNRRTLVRRSGRQ